jgi:hypothetical protein
MMLLLLLLPPQPPLTSFDQSMSSLLSMEW